MMASAIEEGIKIILKRDVHELTWCQESITSFVRPAFDIAGLCRWWHSFYNKKQYEWSTKAHRKWEVTLLRNRKLKC